MTSLRRDKLSGPILGRKERANDFGQCIAEFYMLVRIQVYTVNHAGRGHSLRVKEKALEIGSHAHVCVCKARASVLGAAKLRRNAPLRRANLGRAYYQDRRHRHSWLNRRLPHLINKRSYT